MLRFPGASKCKLGLGRDSEFARVKIVATMIGALAPSRCVLTCAYTGLQAARSASERWTRKAQSTACTKTMTHVLLALVARLNDLTEDTQKRL